MTGNSRVKYFITKGARTPNAMVQRQKTNETGEFTPLAACATTRLSAPKNEAANISVGGLSQHRTVTRRDRCSEKPPKFSLLSRQSDRPLQKRLHIVHRVC